MEVIVGSYNQVVFGFEFVKKDDGEEGWIFQPRFTDQGHAGCVKSVSVGGRYLATGSTDETIRLFDLKKHIELGVLVQQSGSIIEIGFAGSTHMLSASEDGTICIWKTKSWECEKMLKGHRGAITSMSVHPSGRLALSISKDKTIKTWNLLTGRAVYTTSIKEVGEIVKWSPNGKSYVIVSGAKVKYFSIASIDDTCEYSSFKYILAVEFLSDTTVIIGGEDKEIVIYDFHKKVVLQRFEAHKVRTKSIVVTNHPDICENHLVFTVSSDGSLKAWTIKKDQLEEAPIMVASIDLPGRATCMSVKLLSPPSPITTDITPVNVSLKTNDQYKEKEPKSKTNKKSKSTLSSQKVKKKKRNVEETVNS